MRYRTRSPFLFAPLLALVAFASSAGSLPSVMPPLSESGSPPLAAPALLVAESKSAPAAASGATSAKPSLTSDAVDEPAQELDTELVYALLVAEVALQRADFEAAFEHFLTAAQLAREPSLAERAVRAALNAERAESARQALELWTELAPDAPKAHQLSAFLALEAGDLATAKAALQQVIKLGGVPGQGYMQAAQILGQLPDPSERLALMSELVTVLGAERDPDAQLALATLAAAAGDDDSAAQFAERAAELRPGWTEPQLFLVRLLVSREKPEQAQAVLERYIRQVPDDSELKLMKAQLHMDAEESEQALAVFDELLERSPERPDVLFAAAVLALDIEDLEAARGYLEVLQRLGERPNDVAFLLGQVEEQTGDPDAASALYAEVEGQNRTNAQVRIARLYAKGGEVARARELFQQLRDQYPGQTGIFFLIEGEMLRDQGLEQQALEVFDRALSEEPDNADLLYARAMLAVGMGQVASLERDLRRILVSDPDHVDALNALGYTLADRTDRLDAAESLIERALQLRPDDPAILDSMGWVLYRQGQPAAAESYLRRALEQGFDAEIAAHLGEVLWTLGRQDEARAVWQHALDEAPEHKYLLRVLSRFRFSQSDN